MQRTLVLHGALVTMLCLGSQSVRAGEPIPDIDVILEQNPGGTLVKTPVKSVADEVLVAVPAKWFDQPRITDVPAGWTASVSLGKRRAVVRLVRCDAPTREDGASVARMLGRAPRDVVPGPPCTADGPRKRRARPMKASFGQHLGTIAKGAAIVESLRDGQVLARAENVDLEVLPPVATAGTLSGLVHVPPTVSPGETVTAQVDPERLPPGGTWTLSGVVLDEASEDEAPPIAQAVHIEQAGAMFQRTRHQEAMSSIRNIRVVAPIGLEEEGAQEAHVEGETGFAITEETMPVEVEPPVSEATSLATADGSRPVRIVQVDAPPALAAAGLDLWSVAPAPGPCRPEGEPQVAAIGRPTRGTGRRLTLQPCASDGTSDGWEDGQLFLVGIAGTGTGSTADTASIADAVSTADAVAAALVDASLPGGVPCGTSIVRMTSTRPPGVARGPHGETIAFTLPAELPVGAPLQVRYDDEWGRTLLDVPSAEGVEVVPPSEGVVPALVDGTRVVVAGTPACACGRFPTVGAQTGLVLGDLPLDRPLAASGSSIRFEVPPTVALGPHEVLGDPSRGFAAGDGFPLDVIRIDAELDQNELLRGGSTTMRLVVVGSTLPLRIEVINRSPSVIAIDGGDRQVVETTGGGDNSAARSVRATGKGAFDIGWSLAFGDCPCGDR